MLPSRGLPPRQLASVASRQSSTLRSATSRKFSSIPRKNAFSTPSGRTSGLRSTTWRAGATSNSNAVLSSSSVRYGSWYAPWSWGRSSSPAEAVEAVATKPAEVISEQAAAAAAAAPTPNVTTATPEIQPENLAQAAPASSAQSADPLSKTVEDLLQVDPTAVADVNATAISYWGNMKDLGLDYGWGPSSMFESLLELTYINTELGWAGAIIASALILRAGLFVGFQRPASDAMAATASLKPAMQPLLDEMEEAKRNGDDDKVQALKLKQQQIMKEFGGPMLKSFSAGAAQAVFGFGAFRSLRGMATLPLPGLATGGYLWFNDLTVADPYYILPVVTGGIMYSIMRMGGETGLATESSVSSMQKQAQVVLPVIMTAVTAYQPAALQLYFFCTSVTGGLSAYALRQPGFRRFIRIKPIPSKESNEIYTKAINGEIKLSALKGPDGKIRYQAPSPVAARRSNSTLSAAKSASASTKSPLGFSLKPGAALPPHMKAAAAAEEAEAPAAGMPSGGIGQKWDYVKKTYRPSKISEGVAKMIDGRSPEVKKQQEKKAEKKRAAEKYEEERKRRWESGR